MNAFAPAPSLPRPRRRTVLAFLAALLAAATSSAQSSAPPPANGYEKVVLTYEAADKLDPPPAHAILLAGDSQFYRWKTLHEDLPGYTIINRGIDGFQTSDLLHYLDRLVLRYRPRLIVLHVGGNDVHHGKSPATILADFQTFVARVRAALPGVPIAFTSITPGPGRWSEAPARKQTNDAIQAWIATQPGL
ncbi:MAG TPA: GDSL-type esterase/lipase family protein, partial [Opitutus sp.]|nr:GDSL-type esterase/lipase family protein [Opitutus sp.]